MEFKWGPLGTRKACLTKLRRNQVWQKQCGSKGLNAFPVRQSLSQYRLTASSIIKLTKWLEKVVLFKEFPSLCRSVVLKYWESLWTGCLERLNVALHNLLALCQSAGNIRWSGGWRISLLGPLLTILNAFNALQELTVNMFQLMSSPRLIWLGSLLWISTGKFPASVLPKLNFVFNSSINLWGEMMEEYS